MNPPLVHGRQVLELVGFGDLGVLLFLLLLLIGWLVGWFETGSPSSCSWPGTYYVDYVDLPVSVSQVLDLKEYTITPSLESVFLNGYGHQNKDLVCF